MNGNERLDDRRSDVITTVVTLGTELVMTLRTGRRLPCRVVAVRHAPFCYVELEPVAGGPRRTLSLRVAERMLELQAKAAAAAPRGRTGRGQVRRRAAS